MFAPPGLSLGDSPPPPPPRAGGGPSPLGGGGGLDKGRVGHIALHSPHRIGSPNLGNGFITPTFSGSHMTPAFVSMTTWAKAFHQPLQLHQIAEEANWADLP